MKYKRVLIRAEKNPIKNLLWYCFDQNNSGGSFVIDQDVAQDVYIQAHSSEEAIGIAESVGIYFDGVEKEMDCECCGNRWSRYDADDGYPVPTKYGENVLDGLDVVDEDPKDKDHPSFILYYYNGDKELYYSK
jgi:hypothetical protein